MSAIKISDIAYNEFKELLEQNDVKDNVIRINLAGMG